MELDKTTLLSVIVWVAGLMSEIIFHDALARSIPGIVLGIVIAVIVIVASYFTIDGIVTDINNSNPPMPPPGGTNSKKNKFVYKKCHSIYAVILKC